ncbi:MAG: hypothetical protein Q7T86_16650 [Hyphomicrobiaceae bacterium]|nr:hypothetical protein [Hyphomicrobiaceae bacterium]
MSLTDEELKTLKKELSSEKKTMKRLKESLAELLTKAGSEVMETQAKEMVLAILKDNLVWELNRKVTAHRQRVVAALEVWWDKYRVTLRAIEGERDAAKAKLDRFMRGLGYAN